MLDRSHFDRYWRIALPVAWVGCVASLVWAAALAVFDLRAAPVAIDIGLLVGIFPLHLGTILTERHLGGGRASDSRQSVLSELQQALIGGVLFVAFIVGRGVWTSAYAESLFLLVPAMFYGASVATGRRYRRWAAGQDGRTGSPAPPVPPPVVGFGEPSGPPAYVVVPPTSPPIAGPVAGPTARPDGGLAAGAVGRDAGADGPWAMPVELARPEPLPRPPVAERIVRWLIRIAPMLIGGVAIVVLVLRGSEAGPVVGPEDRPFYVATIVSGERIVTDEIHEEPPDPPAALRAAACRNYRNFVEDRALGPELAIVDDPSLLRSAELLDGAWAGDPVALDAETFLLQEGDVTRARSRMADEDWPMAHIRRADRYLADRARTPTAGAEDRYVVYTASQTRTRRLLVRLAVDPEAERFEQPRFDHGVDGIEIRMPDGSIVVVDESRCWE